MTSRQVYTLLKITRSVLILNLIVGLLRAIVPLSYAWTLVQVYLIFVLLTIECLLEPAIKLAWVRKLLVAATFVSAIWFTIAVPFSKAPCQFAAYIRPDESVSHKVEGLDWDKHFTDLRVAITNPTKTDYKDFDISIKPGAWINKASILNPISGCDFSPIDGNKISVARNLKPGQTTFTGRRLGAGTDVYDSKGNQYTDLATESGYRLKCLNLPSHYTIRIIFAAVTEPSFTSIVPDAPKDGISIGAFDLQNSQDMNPLDVLGTKPTPTSVTILGTYKSGIKPFFIDSSIKVESQNL